MIDLEATLLDVAEHLDHPNGDHVLDEVRRRCSEPASPVAPARPRPRARVLLAIAAAIVVVAGALVAISPARHAIADWLGIGAVEVRPGPTVPPATGPGTVPGAPATGTTVASPLGSRQLAAARPRVGFTIVTPHSASAGALAAVDVDTRHRTPLVVLRYPRFTIIEVASSGNNGPVLRKVLGSTTVDDVTVAGVAGLWIKGAHEIGFIGRDGTFETDTVRRAGPVLLWERGTVTYRIEGLTRLADAQAIAATLR